MTFNIGNQSGGVINNVARDQHVSGGQQGTATVTQAQARTAVEDLLRLVQRAKLDLTAEDRAALDEDLTEVRRELDELEPRREQIGERMSRVTAVLSRVGALVGAGVALAGPLATVATWLGTAGAGILQLLG